MYKFFGVIICACLFIGAGCSLVTPENSAPLVTSPQTTSPTIPSGFSSLSLEEFRTIIPKHWTLDESQRDSNRAIFIFEKSPEGKPSSRSISFTVFPLPSPSPTLGELMVQSRRELEANGAVITAADIVSTAGQTYLRTDFSLTHYGVSYSSAQYAFIGSENLLLITETTTVPASRGVTPLQEILSFLQTK